MWNFTPDAYTPVLLQRMISANAGGFAAGDYYYNNFYFNVSGIDGLKTQAWKLSDWSSYDDYTGQMDYAATTMAYSKWNDAVYGCFFNEACDGYAFVRWKYDSYRKDWVISELERPWSACAFDSKNQLWAIEQNGDLYKVDYNDGTMTLAGKTGVQSIYTTDGTIDTDTDIFYWCVANDSENALYKVDLTTAKATKLYDLAAGEQIAGMYIAEPRLNTAAPYLSNTALSCTLGSTSTALRVPLRWTMPRYNNAQEALSDDEQLTWKIHVNGKLEESGTEAKGASVNGYIDITEPGYYSFVLTVENSAGTSGRSYIKRWVGPDWPKAASNKPAIALDGNTVTLTWANIQSNGVHGGPVAYTTATFDVVRMPDGKVVGKDLTPSNKKIVDVIEMPAERTEYWYEVTGTVDGKSAKYQASDKVAFGPFKAPFEHLFNTTVSLAGWGNPDADADGNKWRFYSTYTAAALSGSKGHDEYLVTPAIDVEAGFSYPVSINVRSNNYYDEGFELLYGYTDDPAQMTAKAIDLQTIKSTTFTPFNGEVIASQTGRLYMALHVKTADKSGDFYIKSIRMDAGSNVMAPKAVTDLSFTLPRDGSIKATLTFKAPTENVDGQPLTGDLAITAVEIARDGKAVGTITEGLAPGAELTFTDTDALGLTIGDHTYAVTARNAYGAGTAAEAPAFVGPNKPAAPATAKFVEDGNTGRVTITWQPVTTDAEGNTIPTELVTYRIIDREMNTIADNLAECSFTYQAVPAGSQAFVQFGVYAKTAGGENDKMAATDYKCAGTPATTPWKESFANRQISSPFGYNYIVGREPWSMVGTTDNITTPQDDDGGFMYFEAYGGVITALLTGKIDLADTPSPALIYYSYNYGSTDYSNTITVQVDNGDGAGFRDVQKDVISQAGPRGQWNKIAVPLDEYSGQTIIIRFVPGDVSGAFFTLDNLQVTSYIDYNLSARELTVPNVADPGKEFEISFTAVNTGQNTVGNYSMQLWRGDVLVESRDLQNLAPDAAHKEVFLQTLGITDGETVSYHGVISAGIDGYEPDNTTETLEVSIAHPVTPLPTALTATQNGNSAVLSWTAPDLKNAPAEATTETFDNAVSWTQAVEGWKLVDQDKGSMGGFVSNEFPLNGLCSWYVADNDHSFVQNNDNPAAWASHSGRKHLASSYTIKGGVDVMSDDWAITPQLYGGPQDVSAWVRSFVPTYPEDVEFLYSTKSSDPADFVSLCMAYSLPASWQQVRFVLPDGAKYFAIRSRSINKHQLFLDDVTFVPAAGEPRALEILGYNIYRDGVKLNTEPVATTTYTDAAMPQSGTPEYYVTAVFDKGESRQSNHVTLSYSGVAGIEAGALAVRVEAGEIVATGATDDIAVYSTDGRMVARAEAAPVARLRVTPAVYIVRCGARAVKVVVR